jgi:hypothetical protein
MIFGGECLVKIVLVTEQNESVIAGQSGVFIKNYTSGTDLAEFAEIALQLETSYSPRNISDVQFVDIPDDITSHNQICREISNKCILWSPTNS